MRLASCAWRLIHLRLHPGHFAPLCISLHTLHFTFIPSATPLSGYCVQSTPAHRLSPSGPFSQRLLQKRRRFTLTEIFSPLGYHSNTPGPTDNIYETPLAAPSVHRRLLSHLLFTHSSSFLLQHLSFQRSNQALTASLNFQHNRLPCPEFSPGSPTRQLAYLRIFIIPTVSA